MKRKTTAVLTCGWKVYAESIRALCGCGKAWAADTPGGCRKAKRAMARHTCVHTRARLAQMDADVKAGRIKLWKPNDVARNGAVWVGEMRTRYETQAQET